MISDRFNSRSQALPSIEGTDYSRIESLVQLRMRSRKGRKIRPRNRILMEILEACRTPAVEHWVMIKARLGYETFWMHMNRLLKEGKMICSMTEQKRGGRSKIYYSITPDGLVLLDQLRASQASPKVK